MISVVVCEVCGDNSTHETCADKDGFVCLSADSLLQFNVTLGRKQEFGWVCGDCFRGELVGDLHE